MWYLNKSVIVGYEVTQFIKISLNLEASSYYALKMFVSTFDTFQCHGINCKFGFLSFCFTYYYKGKDVLFMVVLYRFYIKIYNDEKCSIEWKYCLLCTVIILFQVGCE